MERTRMRAVARALVVSCLLAGASADALAAEAPTGVVNINTATPEELELLPGIGPAKAKAILEMRSRNGGFKSVDELEQVKGIGKAAVERLRPFATVSGKTTAQDR